MFHYLVERIPPYSPLEVLLWCSAATIFLLAGIWVIVHYYLKPFAKEPRHEQIRIQQPEQ